MPMRTNIPLRNAQNYMRSWIIASKEKEFETPVIAFQIKGAIVRVGNRVRKIQRYFLEKEILCECIFLLFCVELFLVGCATAPRIFDGKYALNIFFLHK